MGDYILNTVNYDYKTLNHEGFGAYASILLRRKGWGIQGFLSSTKTYSPPATPLCVVGLLNYAASIRRKPIL